MKSNVESAVGIVGICCLVMIGLKSKAATNEWIGPVGGNPDWSSVSNWSLGMVPTSTQSVIFTNVGSYGIPTNTIVDEAFGGTIGSLILQTPLNYGMLIRSGQVLSVTENLKAGGKILGPPLPSVTNFVFGSYATLVISNASVSNEMILGNWSTSTFSSWLHTLDMSRLDRFHANLGRIRISDGWAFGTSSNMHARGNLILAKTNYIVAAEIAVGSVGYSNLLGGIENVGSSPSFFILGQSNSVSTDTMKIGGELLLGRMSFNSSFTNSTARFRGQYGTNRVQSFMISDGVNGNNEDTANLSFVDFSQGVVDLLVDKLVVSRSRTNRALWSGRAARGRLRFAAGTIDANVVQLGDSVWPDWGTAAQGALDVVYPGKLIVNSNIELGNILYGAQYDTLTRGELNIEGGIVQTRMITADYQSRNNSINMTNGTLIVSNQMGPGILNFVMVDSSLQLPATVAPSAMVTNLITGGTSNVINIGAVAGLSSYPTQVALIKYQGPIGGAGFNFALGTLPEPAHVGFLSNNAANLSVDVILDLAPTLAARVIGNELELTLAGPSNRIVDLLASTNLSDWTLFTTITNTSGVTTLLDWTTNSPHRFFRARQWP